MELLQKGFTDLEGIQGITFRSRSTIVSTPSRPFISSGKRGAELDVIPSPYLTGFIPPDGKTGILTGRGCVYHCTYCNFSTMFNHTIRYHSVDRVIAELELINSHWDPHSKEKIMIHDDIFSLNVERAKIICQEIIDRGIELPLSLETRADNCDRELIDLMRDAGVVWINFGLESASKKVLKLVKKAPDEEKFLEKIKTAVKWAKEAGIKTSVSIILGLPGEGLREAEETLDFVRKLEVDECYHNVLFLFRGTELFRQRKKYGLKVVHSPTFLPYETIYAYGADKVQPLPNAGLHMQIKMWKKTYCDVLTYGAGDAFDYLLVKEWPEDEAQLCQWLHRLCALHLSVVDYTQISRRRQVRIVRTFIEKGVPVGFYCVAAGDGRSRVLKLYSQTELEALVPEIPFSEWERGSDEMVTFEREEDVEKFAQFLNAHTQDGILSFSVEEFPRMVMDACKWGRVACPALSRGGLVIKGSDVLSCYHGGRIGKIGDDVKTLMNSIAALLHKRSEERHCGECELINECSRCLFPFPFADSQFCYFKRKYPFSKIIPLLEWLYTYIGNSDVQVSFRLDGNTPLFYHGEQRKGESLPEVRRGVFQVLSGGKAFVFTERKSFSLDPAKAAILEACSLRVGKEYLTSHVKMSQEAIDGVLLVFRELGFLI